MRRSGGARWTDDVGPDRVYTTRATAVSALAAGLGLVGVGLWARRDVRHGLERERIAAPGAPPDALVTSAGAARSLAEAIRTNTLSATDGMTYAETAAYVDADGQPTDDRALAARDALTNGPVENPAHDLWIQSMTLQTALMQAYLAQRLAELTIGLGAVFVCVGAGLAATTRR